jgi:hypothetical protein
MLRGSELCVMLNLGKGMVKIGLSKDLVKPVCPFTQAQSRLLLYRMSISLNVNLT